MNTDTHPTPGRKAHARGLAAAVIAAARAERGLHQAKDVPSTYRVGREIIGTDGSTSGYGVAYPPKFAAAHMPFATTTRQLKRGFVILTEAEAAEIAVQYVAEDGRGVEAANERLAHTVKIYGEYAQQHPGDADRYARTIAFAEKDHAETIAKLAKARTRYGKLLAKAQPATEEVTVPELTETEEATLAVAIDAKLAEEATPSWEDGITAARLQAARQVEDLLTAAAAAKVMADRRWRETIVAAAGLGLSHRKIAELAGCTHPTVSKVLGEEAAKQLAEEAAR